MALRGRRRQRGRSDTLRPIVAYFAPYFLDEQLAPIGLWREDFVPVRQAVAAGDYDRAAAAVTDEMLRLAIVGTPADAVAAIGRLADAGVTQVCIGGPLGPDPGAAVRLIGERVIPAFLSIAAKQALDVVLERRLRLR